MSQSFLVKAFHLNIEKLALNQKIVVKSLNPF